MRNVIWLFIDSFSNIWISEDTMPFLNELLKNCLYFEQCVTTVPYTAGSWMSQVTGRTSQRNGYRAYHLSYHNDLSKADFLSRGYGEQSSVISAFKDAGYYIKFDSPTVGNKDWIHGYDERNWSSHPSPFGDGDLSKFNLTRPEKEPFVWILHYLGVHHITCTDMPKNMGKEKYLKIVLPYLDSELQAFAEHYVGPDDILVLTSDHGTSWNKAEERHHGASLLESGIRILFAIRGAGTTSRIIEMTRSIDVGPTLAHFIGAKIENSEGIDLLGGGKPHKVEFPRLKAFIETGASDSCPHWHNIFGIRTNSHKYVFDFYKGESLYTVGKLVEDNEYICADYPAISDPPLQEKFHKEMLSCLEDRGLAMQARRLEQLTTRPVPAVKNCSLVRHRDAYGLLKVDSIPLLLHKGDSCINLALEYGKVWERSTSTFILKRLKPGQVFVDVGAHIGYYTILASILVGDKGHVYAFEPCTRNFEVLKANILLNNADNVTSVRKALADHNGQSMLHKHGGSNNYGQYTLTPTSEPVEPVDTVRLDDIIPHQVDVIKIDTEGTEKSVIEGMPRILEENPSLIVILEDHNNEVKNWLVNDLGFEVIYTDWYKKWVARNYMLRRKQEVPKLVSVS